LTNSENRHIKKPWDGERRVAITPILQKKLIASWIWELLVEKVGAGVVLFFSGFAIIKMLRWLWKKSGHFHEAEVLLKIKSL